MKMRFAPLFVICGTLAAAAEEITVTGIEAIATTATASVRPAPGPKRTIVLPSLDYELSLSAFCPEGQLPVSTSASIADTRRKFEFGEANGEKQASTRLTVPAAQIAPVVTDNFCSAGEQQSLQTLEVTGVLTAQISLRCGVEEAQSAYFLNLPLSVQLVCEDESQVESLTDK